MNTRPLLPLALAALLSLLVTACSSSTQTSSSATSTSIIAAPAGSDRVSVAFEQPEKFTDLKDGQIASDKTLRAYLEELRAHLVENAPRYMADGQLLTITITDVDMAGDFEPWRGPQADDIRIVRDIYPPRINLTFTLTDAHGAVLAEGPRQLRDLSFMSTISPLNSSDPLRYEKALLDDWLRREFAALKPTH